MQYLERKNHDIFHVVSRFPCYTFYVIFIFRNFISPLGQWTHQCHCVNSPTFCLGAVFALALKWRTCTSLYFVLTTKVIVLEDDTSKYVKFSPSLTFQGSSNISTLTASTVFHSIASCGNISTMTASDLRPLFHSSDIL